MQGFEKTQSGQLRLLIGKRKKKDSQLFGSLLCSRCLGSSRKKQRLKRKLEFFVCSQACHTTSSTAIFSTAVGISVLICSQVRARFCFRLRNQYCTSSIKIVTWFGRNALVTRVVCFSRLSKETRHCLQKGFCFILMMIM